MNELRRQLDETGELLDMYLELGEVAAYHTLLPQYKQLLNEWREYNDTKQTRKRVEQSA